MMIDCDFQVQLIKFPTNKIHEVVTENADGTYTIFLDKNITVEYQMKEFEHAMKHIQGRDFEKNDVQKIEIEAHRDTNK